MPKIQNNPEHLRPFIFHGIDLNWNDDDKQALGDCPFCGKRGKFSIEISTSRWRCWSCGIGAEEGKLGGNSQSFLQCLKNVGEEQTKDYDALVEDRGLLDFGTLCSWGVFRSIIDNTWMVPAYGANGKLCQLYKYSNGKLFATAGLSHGLFGKFENEKSTLFICEGPWDAMAFWETLGKAKPEKNRGLVQTSNQSRSLLADSCVIAVPGVTSFSQTWVSLCGSKIVNLMFDSDHPRRNKKTGAMSPPPGLLGLRRVANVLLHPDNQHPPEVLNYLHWGPDGYDPRLASGFDLRDALNTPTSDPRPLTSRLTRVSDILDKIHQIPSEWIKTPTIRAKSKDVVDCLDCRDYHTLQTAWKKALRWTDGLDRALSVMLASIASTQILGDQLWVKIIGPASCGKSTLCEAVSVAKRWVMAKSTLRGFHSGFTDASGKDYSLTSKIGGKTLVVKDGDALFQAPNLPQILSEARDLYDGSSRTSYRTNASKDYSGVRMTWILCGTASLRSIDSSELGERFLDCVIMDKIDEDLEDDVSFRVANRAYRNLSLETNGQADSQQDPDLTKAMALTGGYVCYLRENATNIMPTIDMDESTIRFCTRLGKFVAYMRARPSRMQDESAEREFSARLVSQHTRLSGFLAFVLNKQTVDNEVMRRVSQITMDTSRGMVLDVCRHLYQSVEGSQLRAIYLATNQHKSQCSKLLMFLRDIGAVEYFVRNKSKGVRGQTYWRLTDQLHKLYSEVTGE